MEKGDAYPRVKCVVDTCTHYITGDYCSAGNIDILFEEEGRMAQTIEQTMCKTYAHASSVANMIGSMDNVNWSGTMSHLFTGDQVRPTITCVVSSCEYWADGNLCVAEAIEVTGRHANECQDTNCQTYRKKQS
ncbi:DUF1540 domain-containing protein [Effusibacillus dendaii]|uniref:DUF1540 domain-containing protein n=1 Tax=Effusibacillus dendaii TaxID=2743772 RepID=A0A7I8DHD7_9BACL|nr:DUF1540 domain-containing protein [Effusibacillus dendaii]BCJ88429.1 hypothetical protein skT53_34140 [Effusibacillus dendaii]